MYVGLLEGFQQLFCIFVALISGFLIPFFRFFQILGDALAAVVASTEIILSNGVILVS